MEKNDKECKRPFAAGSVRDNLIDWAGKLKALGEVWGALSWYENEHGGSQTLESCGETLGSIVMDYAELIETAVNENNSNDFPSAWHEGVLKWIEESKGEGGSAGVIDTHIRLIDDFCRTVATPAFLLRNRFAEMKKKYPIKQENASEARTEAAGM